MRDEEAERAHKKRGGKRALGNGSLPLNKASAGVFRWLYTSTLGRDR